MVTTPGAQHSGKYHLMRGYYRTDATSAEPEYEGMVSDTIPGTALVGRQIVGVDWTTRGEVMVTWLLAGEGTAGDLRPGPRQINHGETCSDCGHDWTVHNIHDGCTDGWTWDEEGIATHEGCYCQLAHTEHSSRDES